MNERDVVGLLLARRDNYEVSSMKPFHGNIYTVTMQGKDYIAVVLLTSFEYYEKRYHLAKVLPSLVVCFEHNTVLPIPVLSLRAGNLAKPYELPLSIEIKDLEVKRRSKLAHKVLLGMYMSGMKAAQGIVKALPETTRRRYTSEIKALGKRGRGRPVGVPPARIHVS